MIDNEVFTVGNILILYTVGMFPCVKEMYLMIMNGQWMRHIFHQRNMEANRTRRGMYIHLKAEPEASTGSFIYQI